VALATGEYVTKETKTVIVWPQSSHDGDGELVYEQEYDRDGTPLGETVARDKNDRELRYWSAPEGFVNKPGYDHTDNFVWCDKRGAIKRGPNGEAYVIRPGEALVVAPDGSSERLVGERAQRLFDAAHEKVSEVDPEGKDKDTDSENDSSKKVAKNPNGGLTPTPLFNVDTPTAKRNEVSEEDFDAFEEWKRNR
jgi:hypothetical protein